MIKIQFYTCSWFRSGRTIAAMFGASSTRFAAMLLVCSWHAASGGCGAKMRRPLLAGIPWHRFVLTSSLQLRGGGLSPACREPAVVEIACTVEDEHMWGNGRVKKWKGSVTGADELLAGIRKEFNVKTRRTVQLQYHDNEVLRLHLTAAHR